MSGLFGSPSVPAPPPAPVIIDDTEEKERKKRLAALLRRRRGRSATIATSDRGLLAASPAPDAPAKTLLGD